MALVRLYQLALSPLLGRHCRFYPSCSQYAREAILRKGPWVGVGMALWRILRCNPFSKGGCDPVEPDEPAGEDPAAESPHPLDER